MKRFILLLIILLMLIPIASAKVMYQFNTTVIIHEDELSEVEFNFKFSDDIKEVEIPISHEITDLEIDNGVCEVREELGTILHCEPSSPFIVGMIKITTSFKTKDLIERRGNISFFSLDIPILWKTDNIFVTIKLPENMALAEKVLLPISPSGSDIRLDGRRLIIRWSFEDKEYGDLIPIRVYYESISPRPIQLYYEWIIVFVIILIVGIVLIYWKVSKKSELIYSVLSENEKMIVDIIKKEEKQPVDQRKIVSLSGFSKAKVSRIIQSLCERDVVEAERVGRKNKITLKKKLSGG